MGLQQYELVKVAILQSQSLFHIKFPLFQCAYGHAYIVLKKFSLSLGMKKANRTSKMPLAQTIERTQQILFLSKSVCASLDLSIIPLMTQINELQMRLSERDNVLIMSAIYSESLTHSVFSSPYPSVSRAICHVTRVTVSSVVESFISA